MNKLFAAVAVHVLLASTPAFAQAQETAAAGFQISPYVGALIPTGGQRDVLDDAVLTGVTLSYELHRYLSAVGTFGWAATESKDAPTLGQDLNVLQYDVGLQGQYPFALGKGLTLKPFVGAGLGVRSYDFADLDVNTESDFVHYFAAGAALEYRHLAVGVTVRDTLGAYDGLVVDEDSSTHNDLAVFASVGARF
jgi:hypothetical protein